MIASVPAHLPNSTRANLDVEGNDLARLITGPGSDGEHFTLDGILLGRAGNDDAAWASMRRTRTRSCNGLKPFMTRCFFLPKVPTQTRPNYSASTDTPR